MRVLSGKLKGLKILTNDKKLKGSESFITRPTSDRVKETLFNILEYGFNFDFSQTSFFDCFSGSGAIGIEAISRGSSIVTFLDKDGAACECITKNLAKFKLHENDHVNCVDVINRDFFSKNLSAINHNNILIEPIIRTILQGQKIFLTCIEQPRHHLLLPWKTLHRFFSTTGVSLDHNHTRLLVNFLIRCCIVVIQ